MSDHGFTTLKKEVYLNVWLENEGYLSFQPDTQRDLVSLDPRTRAYSLDPGRLYVNLAGREPDGSVSAGASGPLLDELESRLGSLRDPESGEAIVNHVYRSPQIYDGPFFGRAPDLLVMPRDGFDIKGTFESDRLTGRGKLVGMHKYDNATLFVRGKNIAVDHASVHDVLPTACRLMEIACPPDVDGSAVVSS
jgi:predicted AlkP superfamily phosphohydrolase/phosphomutase